MERDKEPIEEAKVIEEEKLESNNSIFSPSSTISQKEYSNLTPRITTALARNLASRRDNSLLDNCPTITEGDPTITLKDGTVIKADRKNKPFFATPIEVLLYHALEDTLSKYREDEDIKELREVLLYGGDTKLSKDGIIWREVDLYWLASIIYQNSAQKFRDKVLALLQAVSNKTQSIEIKANLDGREITQRVYRQPLLINMNTRKDIRVKQDRSKGISSKKEDTVKVGFLVTFFQKDTNSFCPIYSTLYDRDLVWWDNDLFTNLLSLVESRYSHQKQEAQKAVHKIKERIGKRRPTPEEDIEIAEEEKKALTYTLTEEYAKGITTTDYSTNPKMISQFWIDLEKSIGRLINYKLLQPDSKIDKAKRVAYLVFTNDFQPLQDEELRLLKDEAKKRKEDSKTNRQKG